MTRGKKDGRLFVAVSILATFLSGQPHLRFLQAQQTVSPPAPVQRMRRIKGEPPKIPASAPSPSGQAKTSAEDDEVVRVDTDLANILLTAIDKNRQFITTLKRED